jgi:hypothetical protein
MTYRPVTKSKLFRDQQVDHFDSKDRRTWSHPYFVSDDYFYGPGSPIYFIVILGGEGPISRILYPFVTKKLALRVGSVCACRQNIDFMVRLNQWEIILPHKT